MWYFSGMPTPPFQHIDIICLVICKSLIFCKLMLKRMNNITRIKKGNTAEAVDSFSVRLHFIHLDRVKKARCFENHDHRLKRAINELVLVILICWLHTLLGIINPLLFHNNVTLVNDSWVIPKILISWVTIVEGSSSGGCRLSNGMQFWMVHPACVVDRDNFPLSVLRCTFSNLQVSSLETYFTNSSHSTSSIVPVGSVNWHSVTVIFSLVALLTTFAGSTLLTNAVTINNWPPVSMFREPIVTA